MTFTLRMTPEQAEAHRKRVKAATAVKLTDRPHNRPPKAVERNLSDPSASSKPKTGKLRPDYSKSLVFQVKMAKLPKPHVEYYFAKPRLWRFDLAWPNNKNFLGCPVACEIEGGAWIQGRHTRGKGYIADMAKYSEASLRGWCVIRVTPQQVDSGEALRLIQRALI